MPKPPAASPSSAPPADPHDRALAAEALRKRQAGLRPSSQESAALRRVQKASDEASRWEHYRTIPQKHWRQMSGRQAKVINEQAALYGIPFDGATIDLPAVVRKLHDLLAEHGRKILAAEDPEGDPDTDLKRIKAVRQKFAHQRDLGEWIAREDVHAGMAIFAEAIRRASERLQREHGPDAGRTLEEAFADVRKDLEIHFAPPAEPDAAA